MRQFHEFLLNESRSGSLSFSSDQRFQVIVGLWLTWTAVFFVAIGYSV
jgi:hypothetical protein